MKFNIISHITTACNYDCSYCDVVKDNRNISSEIQEDMFFPILSTYVYWFETILTILSC